MKRRNFIKSAAVASFCFKPRLLFSQSFDLIIRNGRVIDPSLNLDTIADLGITGGQISAIEAEIDSTSAEEIDARDKIVVPGLLDIHAHYAQDDVGPHICLSDGVTGWVDAGSAGADNVDDIIAVARSSPQDARILLNIGRRGVIPEGDTADMSLANVEVAKAAIARNIDYIVGVKARMTEGVTANDLVVIRRAQEVASYFNLPLMIHMGQSASSMATLVAELKPGDVVTHMYAPPPSAIIDATGKILPEILEARRRGIWFDVANGRVDHLRWNTFDAIMETGFWPDTISTDGFSTSRNAPGVQNFPNIMSKFLNFGMTLNSVVAASTLNPSRIFPFLRNKGTLNIGAPADIAVLELRQGSFEFFDNYESVRTGTMKLFPFETVLKGQKIPRV
ncbi:MAG: amidohydrolase family protein [Gammaproteobacteria bacterium]|nr:amidohydrolase family protein [Gammaproteobacteria bacterium]